MADFYAMGGYALYVWGAWGTGLGILATITINAILADKATARDLQRAQEQLSDG